jgi:hypothetical protein
MFKDHTYVEMRCIGDYADFIVYDPHINLNAPKLISWCVWIIPGTWRE